MLRADSNIDNESQHTPTMMSMSTARRHQPLIDDSDSDDGAVSVASNPVYHRVHRWTCASRVLAFGSVLVVMFFTVALLVEPSLLEAYVKQYTAIDNSNAPFYDAWLNPKAAGIPVYRKYYFYNVTNPFEIITGVVPNLIEIGPYVYEEITQKYDVRWFINGSVGYKYKRLMHFVPDMSIDELTGRQLDPATDVLTTVNPALKGILYRVGKLPWLFSLKEWACGIINGLVNYTVVGNAGYFVQRTPVEFLWGYPDPIWTQVHSLLIAAQYNASTQFLVQWNGSAVVPSPYTYRAGQMCPLWMNLSMCNSTGHGLTMEISGRANGLVTPPSQQNLPDPATWLPLNPHVRWPSPAQAPLPVNVGPRTLDPNRHGIITQFAGQLSNWWWGPEIDGMTGGMEGRPLPWWHNDSAAGNAAAAALANAVLAAEAGSTTSSSGGSSKMVGADPPVPDGIGSAADCRRVDGTDGMRFPPLIAKGASMNVFVDMVGRSFEFADDQDVDFNGVDATRYTFADATLDDSAVNRYCYGTRFRGFFNLSRPAFGPGLASPAFFQRTCFDDPASVVVGDPNGARRCVDPLWVGDPKRELYLNDGFTGPTIIRNLTFSIPPRLGMPPSPLSSSRMTFDDYVNFRSGATPPSQYYENYIDVHRLTGGTLRGHADAMVSLLLGPFTIEGCGWNATFPKFVDWHFEGMENIFFFNNTLKVPHTVIPFLRMKRVAEAAGTWLERLKHDLLLLKVLKAMLWVGLACGILGIAAAALIRLLWVPRIANGNPAHYDMDDALAALSARGSATGAGAGRSGGGIATGLLQDR